MKIKKITKLKKVGLNKQFSSDDYNNKINTAKKLVKQASNKNPISKVKIVNAIGLYNEAISIDSSKAEPYIAIAYISWQFGEFKDAISLLKTVKKKMPMNLKVDNMIEEIKKDFIKNDYKETQAKHSIKSKVSKNSLFMKPTELKFKSRSLNSKSIKVRKPNTKKSNMYECMLSEINKIKE